MTINLSASKQQTSVPISLSVNQTVNQKDAEQNPYNDIEKTTQTIRVEYPKDEPRNNDAMIDLVNYLIDKYTKGDKEIVTADMLIDIVREFTGADSVHIDFDDIEVNCCCGGSFKTDYYRKVAAIFVVKGAQRYNLKYNLINDFIKLSKLKVSLKVVRI